MQDALGSGRRSALLDRLLNHAVVIQIEGANYRLRHMPIWFQRRCAATSGSTRKCGALQSALLVAISPPFWEQAVLTALNRAIGQFAAEIEHRLAKFAQGLDRRFALVRRAI